MCAFCVRVVLSWFCIWYTRNIDCNKVALEPIYVELPVWLVLESLSKRALTK